jgi:hypothetical protein
LSFFSARDSREWSQASFERKPVTIFFHVTSDYKTGLSDAKLDLRRQKALTRIMAVVQLAALWKSQCDGHHKDVDFLGGPGLFPPAFVGCAGPSSERRSHLQAGRDRPEWVVAINRNAWSAE